MRWLLILILVGIALAILRVLVIAGRQRAARLEAWDAKLIRQMREKGLDPFRAHELDFFFDLPNQTAAASAAHRLEAEGFAIDTHPLGDAGSERVSLHARKSMRLVLDEVTAHSRRFTTLAEELGGRYDGWTVQRDEKD